MCTSVLGCERRDQLHPIGACVGSWENVVPAYVNASSMVPAREVWRLCPGSISGSVGRPESCRGCPRRRLYSSC